METFLIILWVIGIALWYLLCGIFEKEIKDQDLDPVCGFGLIWPIMIFVGLIVGTCAALMWAGSEIRSKLQEKQ